MSHPSLGQMLELGNGLWAITTAWLTVFLAYHLAKVGAQRRIGWARWLFRLPLSMQLALGCWVASLGIMVRSTAIWADRASGGGALSEYGDASPPLFMGTVLAVVGFMCVLRTATRPMLGHWPWVSAVAAMVVYIAVWAWMRLV